LIHPQDNRLIINSMIEFHSVTSLLVSAILVVIKNIF